MISSLRKPRANPFFTALVIFISIFATVRMARAGADEDWTKITALDAGPGGKADTKDQARSLVAGHFDEQEAALRAFITKYPGDPHACDARLRLSHLLAIRADLEGRKNGYAEAFHLLDEAASSPSTPKEKQPSIAYSRITLYMHQNPEPDLQGREALMGNIRKFQRDYPGDHRIGALLAEIASLYDSEPQTERDLLTEALQYADKEGLRMQIGDDLKRLTLLGRPLDLKFDSIQGQHIDIAAFKGRVVLVYFFANWSAPSAAALPEMKRIAASFPPSRFQAIGISLDNNRASLDAVMKRYGVNWPMYFDGKQWQGPLVRNFGINLLPTAWLVDKNGVLRSLNAIKSTEGTIRGLIEE